MNRIERAFDKQKAFIPFVTGGDPDLDTTEKLILTMSKAGADLIEIGIPFSDPVAEGPVIQAADERAIKAGTTTDHLFDMISRIRRKTDIPLVFMTYLNPIYTYGKEKFMKRCKDCGVDGIIVPDMPYEEKDELKEISRTYGITLISMIAPTSKERIRMIAKQAEGFLYCVSSLGVTGVRKQIKTDINSMINEVRQVTSIPCAVGFGISTPEQAKKMAEVSDGAIVGSAIVKLVAEYGTECLNPVSKYVSDMKKAVSEAI